MLSAVSRPALAGFAAELDDRLMTGRQAQRPVQRDEGGGERFGERNISGVVSAQVGAELPDTP